MISSLIILTNFAFSLYSNTVHNKLPIKMVHLETLVMIDKAIQ